MKRCSFIFCLSVSLLPALVHAAQQVLTFQWEKPIIEPDLAAFELHYSVDATWTDYSTNPEPETGTWTKLTEFKFVEAQTVYQETTPFEVPDQSENTYFFRLRAIDKVGNESEWCYGTDTEPCRTKIDFKPPGIVIQLTVVIQAEPPE